VGDYAGVLQSCWYFVNSGCRGAGRAYCAQRPRRRRRWRGDGGARPPLSAAGSWPRPCRLVRCRVAVEPGVPAEAERAVDEGLVAADMDPRPLHPVLPGAGRGAAGWHERVRLPPQLPARHDDEPDPVPKADPPTGSPAAAGTHQGDVTGVGYRVGYDSPSQFSREYRRKFGVLPSQDGGRLSGPAPSVAPSLPLTPMLCDSGVRTRLHPAGRPSGTGA